MTVYINGVAQVGIGDMTKAVYDPDEDGMIAVAEIEMTANKVAEGLGLGSSAQEIDTPVGMPDDFADLSDAQKRFIMVYGI